MTNPQPDAAASLLVATRKSGRPGARLPEACRPTDVDSAFAIQRRVGEMLGERVGGWKCSVPNTTGQLNVARIFASTITQTSPCAVVAAGATVKIEPEVAFVMARDLLHRGTPYSQSEVRAAISQTRFVLEILGTRYADPAAASWHEMMADSMQNQGLFVGPLVPGGLDAALASFPVTISDTHGVLSTHAGRHGDGHPLRPLYWLANFLASRGEGLTAGQIVTTGSYAGAIEVPLGESLSVTFGELGTIALAIARA